MVSKDAPGFEAAASCGGVGASVSVFGTVVASKGKGQDVEIKADEVEVGETGNVALVYVTGPIHDLHPGLGLGLLDDRLGLHMRVLCVYPPASRLRVQNTQQEARC